MSGFISRFAKDRCGATAIEYGPIAGLIWVIGTVTTIGTNLTTVFTDIGNAPI